MFFDRETVYPRRWSEMSLDFRAFFASHGAIMAMFMVGGLLTVPIELAIEATMLAVIGAILAWRRRIDGWRWAGVGVRQLLNTAATVALFVVFGGAVILLTPPNSPQFLPWYLALLNIALFGVLIALRVVRPSRAAYDDDCRPVGEARAVADRPKNDEAPWRCNARVAFYAAFLLVWLDGVASFFAEGAAAPNPESLRLAPFMGTVAHALVVLQDPAVRLAMQLAMFIGIPCVLAAGLLLQYALGVAVFPNLPTRNLLGGSSGNPDRP